jgi:hypothetical protein
MQEKVSCAFEDQIASPFLALFITRMQDFAVFIAQFPRKADE